jgi:hypothetical protein
MNAHTLMVAIAERDFMCLSFSETRVINSHLTTPADHICLVSVV